MLLEFSVRRTQLSMLSMFLFSASFLYAAVADLFGLVEYAPFWRSATLLNQCAPLPGLIAPAASLLSLFLHVVPFAAMQLAPFFYLLWV